MNFADKLAYHLSKCEMILANEFPLYEREQAIFSVFLRRKNEDNFFRQVNNLARDLISFTNLRETADEHIHGEHPIYASLRASIILSVVEDWEEYKRWNT